MEDTRPVPDNLKDHCFQPGDSNGKAAAGAKGGIASGKSKRARKTASQIAEWMAAAKCDPDIIAEKLSAAGLALRIKKADSTALVPLVAKVYELASSGDLAAMKLFLDLLGQMPASKLQIAMVDSAVIDEVEGLINDES